MKIVIERINTSIIVHQTGPFLSVTITVPSVIEYTATDDPNLPVMCEHGCPTVYGDDDNNKLSTGNWSLVNGSSIYSNCSLSNFTNYYLYTCMVDLITSDNLTAVQWTTDAMEDFYRINGGPTTNESTTQFFTASSTDNSALTLSKPSLLSILIFLLYQLLII